MITATRKDRRATRWERRSEAHRRSLADVRRKVAAASAAGETITADVGKLPRTYWCGRKLLNENLVDVRYKEDTGRAHYSKTQRCGSRWACPVCGSTVLHHRAQEVKRAMEIWTGERAGGAYLVTVTIRHHAGDGLAESLEILSESWKGTTGGRAWQKHKAELGIAGYIRSLEITYSPVNGWHPHLHFLMLANEPATDAGAERMREVLLERWIDQVVKHGGKLPNHHGVDVRAVGEGDEAVAAEYVTKVVDGDNVALELSRGDLKESDEASSITPFQLLDSDDAESCRLWKSYVAATKGRWSVFFSRGLRGLLGMGDMKTDQEVVAELEMVGEVAASIDADVYDEVCETRPHDAVEVLRLIEKGLIREAADLLGCFVSVEVRLDTKRATMAERPVLRRRE